jgi:2-polyprenyl-3-methyl-5-hydroxy-6-metoxy-1,4-benzoquinol methylase
MIVIPKFLADLGLWINRFYYKQLFGKVYRGGKQAPAWFDHRIDLYYHWPHNLFWLERGILPRKEMFDGCSVLDLFCGDGFFSRYFYSTIAGQIDGVDKDPSAIAHAKRWHSNPKINYVVLDAVKQDFPRDCYDVIVWFEAIEHLSEAEYAVVAERIKAALKDKGILMGSTPIVSAEHRTKRNWEHQNEFTSVEQLREFLQRDFLEIKIDTTLYPAKDGCERCTAYFRLRGPK